MHLTRTATFALLAARCHAQGCITTNGVTCDCTLRSSACYPAYGAHSWTTQCTAACGANPADDQMGSAGCYASTGTSSSGFCNCDWSQSWCTNSSNPNQGTWSTTGCPSCQINPAPPSPPLSLACPAAGPSACDNGGACGMCLFEVPASYCQYGGTLPQCNPEDVGFNELCEGMGGFQRLPYTCGTSPNADTCFAGFDVYVRVFCNTPPMAPFPPSFPPPPPPVMPSPNWPLGGSDSSGSDASGGSDQKLLVVIGTVVAVVAIFLVILWRLRCSRKARDARAAAAWRDWDVQVAAATGDYEDSIAAAVRGLPVRNLPKADAPGGGDEGGIEMRDMTVQGECSVCLEPFRPGHAVKDLPCGHSFHRASADVPVSLSLPELLCR